MKPSELFEGENSSLRKTFDSLKEDALMDEAIASSEIAEDTGTIKLYTDEGAVKQIIEKIKNTKFPVGERAWCSKCEENIINVIKSI